MDKTDFPNLCSEKEAAQYVGVSRSTFRRWRKKSIGPEFFRFGDIIRYRKEALDCFIKQYTKTAA